MITYSCTDIILVYVQLVAATSAPFLQLIGYELFSRK